MRKKIFCTVEIAFTWLRWRYIFCFFCIYSNRDGAATSNRLLPFPARFVLVVSRHARKSLRVDLYIQTVSARQTTAHAFHIHYSLVVGWTQKCTKAVYFFPFFFSFRFTLHNHKVVCDLHYILFSFPYLTNIFNSLFSQFSSLDYSSPNVILLFNSRSPSSIALIINFAFNTSFRI
jgi:hypothetical protein